MAFQKSNSFTLKIANFNVNFSVNCEAYTDYSTKNRFKDIKNIDITYQTPKDSSYNLTDYTECLRHFKITLNSISFDKTFSDYSVTNKFCEINKNDNLSDYLSDCYIKMDANVMATIKIEQASKDPTDTTNGDWYTYDTISSEILKAGTTIEKTYNTNAIPFAMQPGFKYFLNYLNNKCDLSKTYTEVIPKWGSTTMTSYSLKKFRFVLVPTIGNSISDFTYITSKPPYNFSYYLNNAEVPYRSDSTYISGSLSSVNLNNGSKYLGIKFEDSETATLMNSGDTAIFTVAPVPGVILKITKLEIYTSDGNLLISKNFNSSVTLDSTNEIPITYGYSGVYSSQLAGVDELEPTFDLDQTVQGNLVKTTKYDNYVFVREEPCLLKVNGKDVAYIAKGDKKFYTMLPTNNSAYTISMKFS